MTSPLTSALTSAAPADQHAMITDANGNYRFDKVETNGFYTVTPSPGNYNFNPFNRSFTEIGKRDGGNLYGNVDGRFR